MAREIICGIYKITSPTGRIYIGESVNILKRWVIYKRLSCKNQIKLYNSFNKHTVDNHIFEIVEVCLEEELKCRERFWQDFYDCVGNGLNCTLTECGELKKQWSQESLDKVSGKNSKWYGKPSLSKGVKRDSTNHPSNRLTINTDTQEEYISVERLAAACGIEGKKLRRYLSDNSRNPTVYMYKEDYEQFGKIVPCDLSNFQKEVIDAETGKIYKSTTAAAKDLSLNRRNLTNQLNGEAPRTTTIYYYHEWLSGNITIYTKKKHYIEVIDVKTKTVYSSVKEASLAIGLHKSNLHKKLKNPEKNDTDLMYLEEYNKIFKNKS